IGDPYRAAWPVVPSPPVALTVGPFPDRDHRFRFRPGDEYGRIRTGSRAKNTLMKAGVPGYANPRALGSLSGDALASTQVRQPPTQHGRGVACFTGPYREVRAEARSVPSRPDHAPSSNDSVSLSLFWVSRTRCVPGRSATSTQFCEALL